MLVSFLTFLEHPLLYLSFLEHLLLFCHFETPDLSFWNTGSWFFLEHLFYHFWEHMFLFLKLLGCLFYHFGKIGSFFFKLFFWNTCSHFYHFCNTCSITFWNICPCSLFSGPHVLSFLEHLSLFYHFGNICSCLNFYFGTPVPVCIIFGTCNCSIILEHLFMFYCFWNTCNCSIILEHLFLFYHF